MRIVLASGSPRRRELLGMLGVDELIIRPAQGEENAGDCVSPEEIVRRLSAAKAREVALAYPGDETVVAADTIVWCGGRVFGKPADESEAADMLRALSGKGHEVYTGVTVIRNGRELCQAERTEVFFRDISEDEIRAYIAGGEPVDKAGAYGIQGKASLFIEGIEGDYYNVMGLPLCRLGKMLSELGVHLL